MSISVNNITREVNCRTVLPPAPNHLWYSIAFYSSYAQEEVEVLTQCTSRT